MEHYEVIKESIFWFHDLDHPVRGRIAKIIKGANAAYQWDISHYCRLENEMDVYTPSAPFGNSIEETEHKLMNYIKRFENAVQLKSNVYY